MPTDSRVDKYITAAPEFARPILEHVRDLIHKACPEVEEDIKWSRPSFLYRGKILLSMAAFKAHCRIVFWNADVNQSIARNGSLERVTAVSDLPAKRQLIGYIREALRAIEEGSPVTVMGKRNGSPKSEAEVPAEFAAALGRNRKAAKAFDNLSPSHRREYIEWIAEAKREETRQKRIATALEWIAEGKPRHWKYM